MTINNCEKYNCLYYFIFPIDNINILIEWIRKLLLEYLTYQMNLYQKEMII